MNKLLIVAKHELLTNIRRRSFLFGLFGGPIFTIVLMAVIFAVMSESETNTERIGTVGYVDYAQVLTEERSRPETFLVYADEDSAQQALDAGEIGAYFVLPEDYMTTSNVQAYSQGGMPSALRDQIRTYLRANLLGEASPALIERLNDPFSLAIHTTNNGRTVGENGAVFMFLTPIIFITIFMIASQTTSGYLMSGIVEEKTNRIMEILITTISPFQLLMGKIIGLCVLGLIQLGVWLVLAFVIGVLSNNIEALQGISLPPDIFVLSIVYFLLSYFLYGSIMAGLGAMIGSEQESRQYAGLFSIVNVIPFFFIVQLLTDPNGTLAVALSLIPFTAPATVLFRVAFTAVPAWHIALSLVVLVITTILVTYISARVFRWSLLLYGKRPSIRQIMSALRPRSGMATTPTEVNS